MIRILSQAGQITKKKKKEVEKWSIFWNTSVREKINKYRSHWTIRVDIKLCNRLTRIKKTQQKAEEIQEDTWIVWWIADMKSEPDKMTQFHENYTMKKKKKKMIVVLRKKIIYQYIILRIPPLKVVTILTC